MNLFEAYGIKEVADVTFYDTSSNKPVLFLDTLKVSTIEETAEQAEARGGKGNSALVVWDYGKDITLTIEDALFSPKSLAAMYGAKIYDMNKLSQKINKTARVRGDGTTTGTVLAGKEPYNGKNAKVYDHAGKEVTSETLATDAEYLVTWEETAPAGAIEISIDAQSFPGTYKVVGDTFVRNRATGKDEFFQFVIPLAKMSSENTLTMSADGDPSTFSMTMKVLRPEDGKMMKLIKYPGTLSTSGDTEGLIIDMGTSELEPAGAKE